jgi:hypothetical protein
MSLPILQIAAACGAAALLGFMGYTIRTASRKSRRPGR